MNKTFRLFCLLFSLLQAQTYVWKDGFPLLTDPAGTSLTLQARKIIYNGQVYILWGEKIYTLQGQEVK